MSIEIENGGAQKIIIIGDTGNSIAGATVAEIISKMPKGVVVVVYPEGNSAIDQRELEATISRSVAVSRHSGVSEDSAPAAQLQINDGQVVLPEGFSGSVTYDYPAFEQPYREVDEIVNEQRRVARRASLLAITGAILSSAESGFFNGMSSFGFGSGSDIHLGQMDSILDAGPSWPSLRRAMLMNDPWAMDFYSYNNPVGHLYNEVPEFTDSGAPWRAKKQIKLFEVSKQQSRKDKLANSARYKGSKISGKARGKNKSK